MTISEVDVLRNAEILAYELLERPTLPALQSIVDAAKLACGARVAEINLVTATEQRHIASTERGVDLSVGSRKEDSMCGTVISFPDALFVLPDAREHPVLCHSPFVNGELAEIVFYAAAQLRAPSGTVIGTLCVFDTVVRHPDERGTAVLASLADAVVEVMESYRLLTELRSALKRVADNHHQLRNTRDRLEEFAGQVSHEMQGPLASVFFTLQLLEERYGLAGDAQAGQLVARALGGAGRMQRTIVDLMDFALLGGSANATVLDTDALLADVLVDLAIDPGLVELRVGPLPPTIGNESQIRAVVSNLVSNAVKFSSGPGRRPCVQVTGEATAAWARISVEDNGPGVPASQREDIFRLLVRGAGPEVRGHGIGLSTCARILAAHGGEIGVKEAESGGSVFWFELPMSAASWPSQPASPEPAPPAPAGRSVLGGAPREVEHPLEGDLGPALGLGVDLDDVDDLTLHE